MDKFARDRLAKGLAEIGDRLEDRGDHQIGHGADQASHDDENRGHDECHDALQIFVELLVIALGRATQGLVDFSGLFAHGNHVDEQGRERTIAD